MKKNLFLLSIMALICACSMNSPVAPGYPDAIDGEYYADVPGGEGGGNGSEGNEQSQAGVVTAGEWRDLDNWLFWSNLMTNTQADQAGNDFTSYSSYWGFYTNNRVAVRVLTEDSVPCWDVPVRLVRTSDGTQHTVYEARTDNTGEVSLWVGLTQQEQNVDTTTLALVVNGQQHNQPVSVTHWGELPKWNNCTASTVASADIDIAFIVDATGSMMDEIDFLKADLMNIITSVGNQHPTANIRTGAVFYRDEDGDEYVTRESDFTANLGATVSFIQQQSADGGGDYPEAVHIALEKGLQKLSWRESNCIRLAFLVLDAPPHQNDNVIARLQKSIPQYAKTGIRIIPVAASGVDKPTEFFLRFAAIATDGTYVFLTNDSGVGGDHLIATVGQYEVERLNELIERLISQYLQ